MVVNCAAISAPSSCEMDPATAMSVNVPSALVKWLLSFGNDNTLLIHLSTDHGNILQRERLYIYFFDHLDLFYTRGIRSYSYKLYDVKNKCQCAFF